MEVLYSEVEDIFVSKTRDDDENEEELALAFWSSVSPVDMLLTSTAEDEDEAAAPEVDLYCYETLETSEEESVCESSVNASEMSTNSTNSSPVKHVPVSSLFFPPLVRPCFETALCNPSAFHLLADRLPLAYLKALATMSRTLRGAVWNYLGQQGSGSILRSYGRPLPLLALCDIQACGLLRDQRLQTAAKHMIYELGATGQGTELLGNLLASEASLGQRARRELAQAMLRGLFVGRHVEKLYAMLETVHENDSAMGRFLLARPLSAYSTPKKRSRATEVDDDEEERRPVKKARL